jgi:hypothetical protein
MTLGEVIGEFDAVRQVFYEIGGISVMLDMLSGSLLVPDMVNIRSDGQFISNQRPSKRAERGTENDRVFPLETVRLQQFRTGQGAGIERAVIHTGPYADELVRSFNALALTIGRDIFFRDRAYDPAGEEGRKRWRTS